MKRRPAAPNPPPPANCAPIGEPACCRAGTPWCAAERNLLGLEPDAVMARRLQRTLEEVVAMRKSRRIKLVTPAHGWTPRMIKLLGKITDPELARRFGLPRNQVRVQRLAHKIPPFQSRPPGRIWTAPALELLGRISDAEVARRLGCTPPTVRYQRIARGIPAWSEGFERRP